MALKTSELAKKIKSAFKDQTSKTDKPDAALEDLANKMASAIEAFVKSGKVTVEEGITVATTGSATAQSGFTTSEGIGSIS